MSDDVQYILEVAPAKSWIPWRRYAWFLKRRIAEPRSTTTDTVMSGFTVTHATAWSRVKDASVVAWIDDGCTSYLPWRP
jgi:hypothetical protein